MYELIICNPLFYLRMMTKSTILGMTFNHTKKNSLKKLSCRFFYWPFQIGIDSKFKLFYSVQIDFDLNFPIHAGTVRTKDLSINIELEPLKNKFIHHLNYLLMLLLTSQVISEKFGRHSYVGAG